MTMEQTELPPFPIHEDGACDAVHPCRTHDEWWRWCSEVWPPDLINPIGDRTPIITIELQLRPHVPWDAEPYWWGCHTLTFRNPTTRQPVWEAEIPEAAWSSGRGAYVARRKGFGWVVVLTLMHDKAREVLDRLALPDHVGSPDAAEDGPHGHASRWTYWGEASRPVAGLATADPLAPDTVGAHSASTTDPVRAEKRGSA